MIPMKRFFKLLKLDKFIITGYNFKKLRVFFSDLSIYC
jgi:hypothetical protein